MANFVVLHLEKAKGTDAKMSAHIERTFIARNVDESRIHLDRELIAFPEGVKSRSAAIEHRIANANLKRKVGKNQVHAIRIMISASPEAMERIQQEGDSITGVSSRWNGCRKPLVGKTLYRQFCTWTRRLRISMPR